MGGPRQLLAAVATFVIIIMAILPIMVMDSGSGHDKEWVDMIAPKMNDDGDFDYGGGYYGNGGAWLLW